MQRIKYCLALFVLSEAPFRRLVDFVLVWEEKPKVKKGREIFHFLGVTH